MRDIILSFPQQLEKGIAAARDIKPGREYSRVIACGMGGSMMPAGILSMVRPGIFIYPNYGLPADAGKNDLVLCTSWSGTTEEVLTGYTKARELGLDTIAIATGGRLAELARTDGTPLILLPADPIPPRTGVGYMTAAMLSIFGLEKELEFILDSASFEAEGKEVAEGLKGKVPIFYASWRWRKLASFWKILVNENAKTHAFWNSVPPAVHNEIAGFEGANREQFHPVIIRDTGESPEDKRNFNALLAIFDGIGYNYSTVKLSGEDNRPLQKVFNNYILGLWTSYYLALNLGVKPEDTELIERFKKLKAK